MNADRIESMRTYFFGAGHEIDAVSFARAMLGAAKQNVARHLAVVGVVPREAMKILKIELGDPDASLEGDCAVPAYVNGGEWKAKCECGGCEYVDLERPIFMCASCWNSADAHRWRHVILPSPHQRRAAEVVLLARPDAAARNWRPADGETVAFLKRENLERSLPLRREEAS